MRALLSIGFVFTIRHGPSFSLGGSIGSGKGVVDISLRHLQDVGRARALVAAIIAVIDPITAATHPTCTVVTQVLPSAADYQKKSLSSYIRSKAECVLVHILI